MTYNTNISGVAFWREYCERNICDRLLPLSDGAEGGGTARLRSELVQGNDELNSFPGQAKSR